MKRRGKLLEGWLLSFLMLAGSLGAALLTLARLARFAALLTVVLLLAAGLIQARLGRRRNQRKDLREMHSEIRGELGIGRLCAAIGVMLIPIVWLLPPPAAVTVGFVASLTVFLRGFAIAADSAIKEDDLPVEAVSAADECSTVERWARRAGTSRNRFARRFAEAATDTVPAGEIGSIQSLVLSLMAASVLAFGTVGAALGAEQVARDSEEAKPTAEAKPPTPLAEAESPREEPEREPTYEESCPHLPDPLQIGHGLGALFRHDGGFKAGCGTEARQVLETGAWFSPGICVGRLRSLAVIGADGDKALLYGAVARFALAAAQSGELVSAEGARPDGGDVYVVETMAGSYGFARKAGAGSSDSDEVRNCTDVTGTARPFAELPPPMLLNWRNLIELRAAWSWPLREDTAGTALTFTTYPDGTVTARGACASEFFCYLDVDGVRWPGEGTAYVSLRELATYMPPQDR